MWEAKNCVSVHLLSVASSLVSSKKRRGEGPEGQALPLLLCACWVRGEEFLPLLSSTYVVASQPQGSPEGLEADSPPTPAGMAVEAGTCTAPISRLLQPFTFNPSAVLQHH